MIGRPTPLEKLAEIATIQRKISIGLPSPLPFSDHRFPLTPEAAGQLVSRGFDVKIETGAAQSIHYSDFRYQELGVDIVDRREALRCDLVLSLSEISATDARVIKRGALFLTFFDSAICNEAVLREFLRNNVIAIALDLVTHDNDHRPFADILSEISGRASIALASSLLADAQHGKGILLGGIAGIVPCEVTIIGSGIDAVAAARSALGLGALVRMFDNDVYRLRIALHELGPGVAGSSLHPRVLLNALRSADVVIATDIKPRHQIGSDAVAEMKRGVVIFDLGSRMSPAFPSLPSIDLALATPGDNSMDGQRVCYVNPSNAVPRTAAMALSNTFITMVTEAFTFDGFTNALMLNHGLQAGALTFMGKPVNQIVAAQLGMRYVDISLILQFS